MKKRCQTQEEPKAPTADQPSIPTHGEDRAYELYMEHLKQAWSDCQSGSDEFDKSILAYSSAGLGVSLVFIKDIVPLATAVGLILLYASWVLFGVAILVTVISFQLSAMAQEKHIEHLRKYYLEKKTECLNPPNWAASWVRRLKWVSGICFVLAMSGIIVFSIWNLTEARHMSKLKGDSTQSVGMDGRPTLSMTPLEKGRVVMPMTPLPSATPSQQPQQPTQNVSAHQTTPVAPKTDK
jgi:hypothetical protein